MKPSLRCFSILLLVSIAQAARSDGSLVDKIYHPYVEQLEWELEWRGSYANEEPASAKDRLQLHRLGLGRAVSEFVYIEGYIIGEASVDQSLELEAYEVEVLWQLSEQGEYLVDYGVLFELEKEHNEDIWEGAAALLLEKEFGGFSATANLALIYEGGDDIPNEWESSLALQGRYRYSPRFEPAVEFFWGEDTLGLGPLITGTEKLGQMRALKWEAGVILGLDSGSSDVTVKAIIEYEF